MAAFSFANVHGSGLNFARLVSSVSRVFAGTTQHYGPSGDSFVEEIVDESITLTGTTGVDGVAGLFSANSQFLGAGYEITTAVTGATALVFGDLTGADADRLFASQTTYTAGTKKQIGAGAFPGAQYQGATADNVRITFTGTATAGVIRVWIARRRFITYASV